MDKAQLAKRVNIQFIEDSPAYNEDGESCIESVNQMPLKPRAVCYRCLVSYIYQTICLATQDEETRIALMKEALQVMLQRYPKSGSLTYLVSDIEHLIKERTGNSDPYRAIRAESNRMALRMEGVISKTVADAPPKERLRVAATVSIAGNLIDFSTAEYEFSLDRFETMFADVVQRGLDVDQTPLLSRKLDRAKEVLYLCDNAGEIVFDKPLIRLARERGAKVCAVVKGGPISNDATLEDALMVGLDKTADEVITTGTDSLGVRLGKSSPIFLERLRSSDLIIAKGQSNLESLADVRAKLKQPVFHILRTKCEPIAEILGLGVGLNVVKAS